MSTAALNPVEPDLATTVRDLAAAAREAALVLATLPRARKDAVLIRLADSLPAHTEALLAANRLDLEAGRANGLAAPLLERLTLSPERIEGMAEGVREVAALPDPVGELIEQTTRPNGLDLRKVRVPIGVVGIIYESRPNVTIDCAVLCFKSGNAAVLRGGREAFHTNRALAALIAEALRAEDLPEAAVSLVPTTDRAAMVHLLKLDDLVQCIIPRGGEGLIRFVAENARMPVIKHYTGVCTVYVHGAADRELAEKIVVNAKAQRVSVCNSAENLLVDRSVAAELLPQLGRALKEAGVTLRADEEATAILAANELPSEPVTEEDWATEYLDYILAVKVVDGPAEAIAFINRYGSAHSDAIVTTDNTAAEAFLNGVDSATVYWNASTRFTDGYEFGLGAEIGISTDRLHARGPMGLRELTTYKYQIYGTGQIK